MYVDGNKPPILHLFLIDGPQGGENYPKNYEINSLSYVDDVATRVVYCSDRTILFGLVWNVMF